MNTNIDICDHLEKLPYEVLRILARSMKISLNPCATQKKAVMEIYAWIMRNQIP